MSQILTKKVFTISSALRTSGTSDNFSYTLNLAPDDDFDSVCVIRAQIPKSYYSVRTGKNTFIVAWFDGSGNDYSVITIPVGNYTRKSLANTLEGLLNTIGIGLFTVTYTNGVSSADTGKYSFTYDTTTGLIVTLEFQFTTNIYYLLGFYPNTTAEFVVSGQYLTLTSPRVIDMQLENVLFLRSNICQNANGDNILAEIYTVGDPSYANVLHHMNDLEAESRLMVRQPNNSFRFYITDELGDLIDLNGLDCNFSIICFRKQTIWQKLSGFLNLAVLKM